MSVDLAIRCQCGALTGAASGLTDRTVTRVVCHCSDCQAFAHYLNQADRVLDAHGGTDICQVSPRTVRFDQGADQLACVRLTTKGPYRWYAACCGSPVGNTVPGLAFVGLIKPTVEPDSVGLASDPHGIYGRDAVGDRSRLKAADKIPISLLLRVLRKLLLRGLRGDHRGSPFHDHATGQAAAKPISLSAEERAALEARRLAWRASTRSSDV